MNVKKVVGYAILILLAVSFFVAEALIYGWQITLFAFASATIVSVLIDWAIKLITD